MLGSRSAPNSSFSAAFVTVMYEPQSSADRRHFWTGQELAEYAT
jgi:hypothetical protein